MQLHDQLPASTLASVIEGFAQWRASGISKHRTPQRLQEQAVALLTQHPKSHICKSLNIPYSALKQWALPTQNNDAVAAAHRDAPKPSTNNTGFIQLPTAHYPQSDSIEDNQSHLTQLCITLPNGTVLSTAIAVHTLLALINQPLDSQGIDGNTEQKA